MVLSAQGPSTDLPKRAVSGIIMIALASSAVYLGGTIFASFVAILAGLGAFEMTRLIQPDSPRRTIAIGLMAFSCVFLALIPQTTFALYLDGVAAVVLLALSATFPSGFRRKVAFGFIYVLLGAIALVWLREAEQGFSLVVFLVACVVATDIGAYFTGRALGGPKLAPSISPNKTWSGALGGGAAAIVAALVVAMNMDGGLSVGLIAAAFGLSAISQSGDLFESWLKRKQGVKDSGSIIPGHGGVLDRCDGFLSAAPVAAALVLLAGSPLHWGV